MPHLFRPSPHTVANAIHCQQTMHTVLLFMTEFPSSGESLFYREGVSKPYITQAPYVIVLLEHKWIPGDDGEKHQTYYSTESCGIAAGMLIAAIQNANLSSVVTTPLRAGDKVCALLNRPENERVMFLMPVGYPADNCTVPYRHPGRERKDLSEIAVFM